MIIFIFVSIGGIVFAMTVPDKAIKFLSIILISLVLLKYTLKEMLSMEILIVGLIKGPYQMPVDEYIFEKEIENVHDYKKISDKIMQFLDTEVGIDVYGPDEMVGLKDLKVYVTGLTPVVSELIKCCALCGVSLVLFNFNIETKSYERQVIFQ